MRIVRETGKPNAQVARDLGVNERTPGNWYARDRRDRDGGNGALSESVRGVEPAAAAEGECGARGCSVMSQALDGPLGPRGDGPRVTVVCVIATQRRSTACHRSPLPGVVGQRGLVPQVVRWRPSPRHARRWQLAIEIAPLFTLHHGKYGSPRITADLREAGWRISENPVVALMRKQHLAARTTHRRRGTTGRARAGGVCWSIAVLAEHRAGQ